jgi:hypothetical protein
MSKGRKTRQSPDAGATPQAADEANEPDTGASEPASPDGGGSQDAKPSNSGDRFHFVLVARRMLDMLPPGAAVQRIEVEGVASEDLPSGTSDERVAHYVAELMERIEPPRVYRRAQFVSAARRSWVSWQR